MKKIVSAGVAAIFIAGALCAQETAPVKEVIGEDELVQEKARGFKGVWIRPDADISKYSKFYLWNAIFQFRDVGEKNVNQTTIAMSRGDEGPFVISPDDQEKFKQVVSDAVVKELGRSKQFEVVDVIGPGTLLVRGAVIDIVSSVPPNVGRLTRVHLASVGEATFVFELIDAETGVIQARVGDRRTIQPPSRMNTVNVAPANSATVWSDVEQWARAQAQTLRKELDKAAKKAK